MNEIAAHVTTYELAEALGVDKSTVTKTVKRLESESDAVLHHLTNDKYGNEVWIYTEEAERRNAILMHTSKLYTVTEIAKEMGLTSAEKLNKLLEEKGVQYKVNGTWVPTAKYSDLGYSEIKQEVHDSGYVFYDRKVTQDGRAFILNTFGAASAAN